LGKFPQYMFHPPPIFTSAGVTSGLIAISL
jgi:hypothetical protein